VRALTLGRHFTLTATGLDIRGAPSLTLWQRAGERLDRLSGSLMWWLGDWARYGEATFGSVAATTLDATGYEYQTLANAKWVASRVAVSRRRETLSFGHHAEVAALAPAAQATWLARAERERWSVHALRAALARDRVPTRTDGRPDYWTPPHILDRAAAVLGAIDLDPCADPISPTTSASVRRYHLTDDGLRQRWHGRVFLNPPYGAEVEQWVDHLLIEYAAGRVHEAIVLLAARTDTAWFRKLRQFPRCFLTGRLTFGNSDSAAPFPSVVVYLGADVATFAAAFADLGDVYQYVPPRCLKIKKGPDRRKATEA
jgi:hypothetical protein